MDWVRIATMVLDIYFTIMEKAKQSDEEQLIFYAQQRAKFRGVNAPENLPKPPETEVK